MSLSGGKSKQKSSQTGTSTTTADPASLARYNEQSQGILNTAQAYAATPYQKYQGPYAASLSGDETKARELARGSAGQWQGLLGDAETAAKSGLDYDGSDVSTWMNPFEDSVVAAASRDYDESTARQLNEYNDGVAMRSAFGNSSAALGESELRRTAINDKTDALARLRYAGFNDARNAGFQSQQAKYQGAGILSDLGAKRQGMSQSDVAMLEGLGATERQIEQMRIDAERAEWDAAAADRLRKTMLELEARRGILGANPMGQSTNSSGTASGTNSNIGFSASVMPKDWSFFGS